VSQEPTAIPSLSHYTDAAEHFRLLVEGSTEYAIYMLDPEGRVVSWNTGAERIKGYAAGEILGESFMRFYRPEDIRSGRPQRELHLARQFGKYEEEWVRVRKDGTLFWASVLITALRNEDGHLLGFAKVTRDITSRKLAEEAMRESAAVLQAVFETVVDGIITIDEGGMIVSVNPAVERIFGYEAREMVGRNVKMLMPEPYQGEHDTYMANYRSTGDAKIIGIGREVQGRRKDGSVFPLELAVSEAKLEDRRMFVGSVRDITERKTAEEALRNMNRTLEERVVDRTAQLEGFCYSIAHDLRQHIRGVNINASMLLSDVGEQLEESDRRMLDGLVGAARNMSTLVDDLLLFSRVTTQEVRREPVDVTALAREVSATLQALHPDSEVEWLIEPNLCTHGDGPLLGLVLQNMMENALKYAKPGAATVVEVGAVEAAGRAAFYVRDNGIGFDMRYVDKVFRPFERLHRNSDIAGTGLGLATVKRVVERHGGQVWAESVPGQGATFYFSLEPTKIENIRSAS
jgi:two-component system, LuxR family, sensor kinase FixL